ncbi:MAG TPA: hypothetical protein VFW98_06645 [Gemmatimonadaceae bacterium]|nr:hypothetical protein [Gemmatimonadaceae bacterium]
MITHIDLSTVLRRTVCDLFSDLVTRPTGAAVRDALEQQLAESPERTLTIIDFSQVGLLDFSCADEIVAKLLLRYCAPRSHAAPPVLAGAQGAGAQGMDVVTALSGTSAVPAPPRDVYFLFSGVNASHLDAIETVLERHGLATVARIASGDMVLIGTVDEQERRAWEAMCQLGRAHPAELARATGLEPDETRVVLDTLCRRRLAMRFEEEYVAVGVGQ